MPGIWKIERESGSYLLIIAEGLTYRAENTVLDVITEGSGDDHGNEAKRVYCSWNERSTGQRHLETVSCTDLTQ
jgi:hypothetical protein